MVKVRDRLTGQKINIPKEISFGRYEVIHHDLVQNGHTPLNQGDVLVSDGTDACLIGDYECKFVTHLHELDDLKRLDFVSEAVKTIAAIYLTDPKKEPSPLLPQKTAKFSELRPLEIKLSEIVKRGHLNEITRTPRLDMHYEEEITQISRARRLAPAAERHLASNSSCWQQKTLSGIVPKSILALFSEDDYAIYENKLFARLMDRIEKVLSEHLLDTTTLRDTLKKAEQFNSPDHYHRLRENVCMIWGETFKDDKTLELLKLSESTVNEICRLLSKVRVLKQSKLYRAVPRSCQVPDQIHMTNILTHDQHYRHLVPLWETHRKEAEKEHKKPEQNLASSRDLFDAYVEYVGLVLRRALSQIGKAHNDTNIRITREKNEWQLSCDSLTVVFVPFPHKLQIVDNHPAGKISVKRIPVFLEGNHEDFNPSDILENEDPLSCSFVLTPLDFLVEEKIVSLLNAWIWKPKLQRYGASTAKVPSPVIKYLSGFDPFVCNNSQIAVIKPVPVEIIEPLNKLLKQHASDEVSADLMSKIKEVDLLNTCQGCGEKGQFKVQENKTFFTKCESCQLEWNISVHHGVRKGIFTNGKRKNNSLNVSDKQADIFLYGRWHMEIHL